MSEVNELVHSLAPAIPDWSTVLIPDCIHTVYRMQTNDARLHLPARKTQHAFSRLCHLLFLCRSSVLLHDAIYGVFRAQTKSVRSAGLWTAIFQEANGYAHSCLALSYICKPCELQDNLYVGTCRSTGYAILTLQRMRISTVSGHVCPYHKYLPACQGSLPLCRSTLRRRSKLSASDSFG